MTCADTREPEERAWPGLVLSLLVPGFGCFRAGKVGRWLAWYFGLYAACVLAALALTAPSIPFWRTAVLVIVVGLVAYVWMLVDCFRPGRLTRRGWAVFALVVAGQVVFPRPGSLVARSFKVPTNAMAPTVRGYNWDGNSDCDYVLVSRLAYVFGKPERGDIIVFRTRGITQHGGTPLAGKFHTKRLVALPGENVRIAEGKLLINGRPQTEEDGIPPTHYTNQMGFGQQYLRTSDDEFLLPEGNYFVLGNNSSNSLDSRFWGTVPAENVFGKVIRIYYPFDRAGPPQYARTDVDE